MSFRAQGASTDRVAVEFGGRRVTLPAQHLSAVNINRAEGHIRIKGDGFAIVLPRW
jgi:hypothetical protein